jgi:ribose 5-phosphate isomerase A
MMLRSHDPKIRQGGPAKAVPVATDSSNWIVDAPFSPLLIPSDLQDGDKGNGKNGTWEVHALGLKLRQTYGVVESGLFHGFNGVQAASDSELEGQKPVAAYFGRENGEFQVRVAKEIKGVQSRP